MYTTATAEYQPLPIINGVVLFMTVVAFLYKDLVGVIFHAHSHAQPPAHDACKHMYDSLLHPPNLVLLRDTLSVPRRFSLEGRGEWLILGTDIVVNSPVLARCVSSWSLWSWASSQPSQSSTSDLPPMREPLEILSLDQIRVSV